MTDHDPDAARETIEPSPQQREQTFVVTVTSQIEVTARTGKHAGMIGLAQLSGDDIDTIRVDRPNGTNLRVFNLSDF